MKGNNMTTQRKAQVGRWIRIIIMAAMSTGLISAFAKGTTRDVLIPLVIATAEVVWRAAYPTVPANWAPPAPPPAEG